MGLQVVLVPRWSGTRESDYYPWLARELRERDIGFRVAPLLPSPDEPTVTAGVRSLDDAVVEPALDRTVVVAHSVGCQIALRWLAGRQAGVRVRAFVAVAGWWWIDEPWPSIQPFLEDDVDWARARDAAGSSHVFLGRDDPFTSDQTANAERWRERMGASIDLLEGRAHFNEERFDELLAHLEGMT